MLFVSVYVVVVCLVEGFFYIFLWDLDVEFKFVLIFLEIIGVLDEFLGRVIVLFLLVFLCDFYWDL